MKWYTVLVGFVTAGLTIALVTRGIGEPVPAALWIPGVNAYFALQLTGIGVYVAAIAGCIGALAILYSIKYMEPLEEEYPPTRYYFLTLLFVGSMIALALADNFLVLYIFWEIIGFTAPRPATPAPRPSSSPASATSACWWASWCCGRG